MPNHFTDVDDNSVSCSAVHFLWAHGGVEDQTTTFNPAGNVARADAAYFVVQTYRIPLYGFWP